MPLSGPTGRQAIAPRTLPLVDLQPLLTGQQPHIGYSQSHHFHLDVTHHDFITQAQSLTLALSSHIQRTAEALLSPPSWTPQQPHISCGQLVLMVPARPLRLIIRQTQSTPSWELLQNVQRLLMNNAYISCIRSGSGYVLPMR